PFPLSDSPDADRAGEQVQLQHGADASDAGQQLQLRTAWAEDLGQAAAAAAAKIVELEETVVSQGIAEAEETVVVVGGGDGRDPPVVSVELHRSPHRRAMHAPDIWDAGPNLFLPPGLELVAREARRLAHAGDQLPGSQLFQDFVWWKSHTSPCSQKV